MDSENLHSLIKEIRAIAQTGLHYARDPYDKERYEQLKEIAATLYEWTSDSNREEIEKFFFPEEGYATPKVDLRACVVHDGKILLVRERSDGGWTLPGGWADQNESPREGIVREVKEESGYDIVIHSLYALKDRDRHPYEPRYPVSIYKLFFTASITGGSPTPNTEVSDIGFFPVHDLPPLSIARVLEDDIRTGYRYFTSKPLETLCD